MDAKRLMLLTLTLVLILGSTLFAEEQNTRTEAEVKELRKRFKSKNTAEKIVDIPTEIVFFPLKTMFKITESAIRWSDEHKIAGRVMDLITSDDERRGLRPVYSSRKGAGISLYQRELINQKSKLSFTSSFWNQWLQYYEINFKRLKFFNDNILANITAYYHKLPDEDYYGYGPGSDIDTELDYTLEQSRFQFGLEVSLSNKDYLQLNGGLSVDNIFTARPEDDSPQGLQIYNSLRNIAGFETNLKFAFVESKYYLDTKNRPGNPSRGMDLLLSSNYAWQINDDQFAFWKLAIDWTKYLHLFYNRVLLFRINAGMTEQSGGRDVPFYQLSEIGTHETIRSLERGRYRDKDFFISSLEYRYPVSHNIDALIFMDSGQVTRDLFTTFDWDNQIFTFGGGFRLFTDEGLKARIELGGGKDGFKIQLKLNRD